MSSFSQKPISPQRATPSAVPHHAAKEQPRRRKWPWVFLAALVLAGVAVALFFTNAGSKIFFSLDGERQGRTNILVLGIGGESHPGGNLADSIMLVSLNHDTEEIGLLSIPRDLQVTTEYGVTKINAVHASAENSGSSGPEAMKEIITEVTGQPIHYFARLDFPGFVEFIDSLGGVDVRVETSFLDPLYPNPKYGGDLSFQSGTEHLDGEWALNYARSRYGNNGEGSDFRRAKRQQDILAAVRKKAVTDRGLLDPGTISDTIGILDEHFSTDLTNTDLTRLANIYKKYSDKPLIQVVYDNSAEGPLQSGKNASGSYILTTRTGDYSQTKQIAIDMFGTEIEQDLRSENATVDVLNGARVAGLATKTANQLEELGLTVGEIGDADELATTNTLYDFTGGKLELTRDLIVEEFDARIIENPPASIQSTAEFVLVIGRQ